MTGAAAIGLCCGIGAAVCLGTATAAADGGRFADYLNGADHGALRTAAAVRHMRTICPHAPVLAEVRPRTRQLQPVTMAAGDRWPAAGVWEERLLAAGCGDGRQINLIYAAQGPDTPPTGVAMFPGSTRANWFLQQQAMRPAAVAASKKAPRPDCRRYAVADTDATGAPDRAPVAGDAWRECWLLRACEDYVEITITFSVEAQGGIAIEAE